MRQWFKKTKGDSRHAGGDASIRRWAIAALVAVGCGHGVTLSVPQQEKLTALACDAQTKCQRHADRSDENFPDLPVQDRACILFANEWRAATGTVCK